MSSLDRMLAELHEALGGLLDVESGLRDARRADARAEVDTALGRQLDVGSGLNAILAGPTARGLRGFAEELATRPPHARLVVRRAGWPHIVRQAREIAGVLLTAIDIDIDIRAAFRTTARHQPLDLDRAIRRTRALSRALEKPAVVIFANVRQQVTRLLSTLARIDLVERDDLRVDAVKGQVLDDARSLAPNLLAKLIIGVDVHEQPALVMAVLDDLKEIDRLFSTGSPGAVRQRIQEVTQAFTRIDGLVSDFVGADLTDALLKGVPLDGIRWSDTTRWPDGWAKRIRLRSVEVAPDLFVVGRRGRGRRVRVDQVP